jgi:hypothetical protein
LCGVVGSFYKSTIRKIKRIFLVYTLAFQTERLYNWAIPIRMIFCGSKIDIKNEKEPVRLVVLRRSENGHSF